MSSPSTPPLPTQARSSPSSSLSDDSIIELSFDYEYNSEGKIIRVSKGSTHSSPPTPQEPDAPKPSSSSSLAPRRLSLSRSESMPSESLAPPAPRTLQRVVSGPVSLSVTPAQPTRVIAPLSNGLRGTGRKLGGARRVTREEAQEIAERHRREEEERRQLEEKENEPRPIAALPSRQILQGFPRAARLPKHTSGFNKISEVESSEGERDEIDANASSRPQLHVNRPRRSPSESSADALTPEDHGVGAYAQRVQARYAQPLRPIPTRVRRVTRPDHEYAVEGPARDAEDVDGHLVDADGRQHSPSGSPTHQPLSHPSRPYTHQRRESDTLRSGLPTQAQIQAQIQAQADRDVELQVLPQRRSPPARAPSTSTSLGTRHRRSPTAPEPPTSSPTMAATSAREPTGKTWAAGDKEGYERERERAVEEFATRQPRSGSASSPPQTQQQQPPQQQQPQSQPPPSAPDMRGRNLIVNKKPYARLDMIGKGGSSRVYRVMNSVNEIFAIKRVALDKTDTETIHGYMNEIALLKRLEGNHRIIRLIDSEVKSGPGGSKGHLMLVMECGEIDLAKLLQEQQKEPMNMVWVAYYWQQILQAVHVIHEEKIVHSDLKPANFVLVKGQLKLIDFGIANAIANDTTNIQRDHQIGTVNYMSPEAIELPDGMRRLKVGRPSDVWSLGCILYQMVYGQPPFHQLSMYQKMKAIPDSTHVIDFPEVAAPLVPTLRNAQGVPASPPKRLDHLARPVRKDVIRSMQKCLLRNPRERATIPELLDEDWLAMKEREEPKLKEDETVINPYYMRQLLQYAIRCARENKQEQSDDEQLREAERLVQELKAISSS